MKRLFLENWNGCGGVGGVTHSDKEREWVEKTEAVNA